MVDIAKEHSEIINEQTGVQPSLTEERIPNII
jgi:hypothetical protein